VFGFYAQTLRWLFYILGDVKFVYQFLQKLMLVERFDMTLMFLTPLEKKGRFIYQNHGNYSV
jgi:nicotinamide riboside transporter PnuC